MAKVLSSISGNLISAASAGFAPTNSADVSAIASAYQVVSATGTQLYAGTAHVTSVNSAPISASRAGNAANASMATSAWYDGTGRLISALPDSATVSAIASGYSTSKVDKSAISAQSAQWNSVYNTVNLNSANWSGSTGGGGEVSSPSGTIVVNGSDIEGTNSAVLTASVPGFSSTGYLYRPYIPDYMGGLINDVLPDTGGVLRLSADSPIYSADILLSGQDLENNFVTATATVTGDTRDIVIPLGTMAVNISASASQYINMGESDVYTAEKSDGIQVTGVAELAWKSAVDNVTNTVSSNSATWGQGGVDSATVSAIASSYAESAVSSKADSSALSSYALSSDVSGVIDTVSSNSASWAGGGGVDSATVSSIASSYADQRWPLTSTASIIDASGYGAQITLGNDTLLIGKTVLYNPMTIKYTLDGYPTANFGLGGNSVYGGNTGVSSSYHLLNHSGVQGSFYADGSNHDWQYTTAEYDKLTSTYDTVSGNSATWGATPTVFPAEINTGSTTKAIVTTGFQDGTGSRPTLFISSNPDSVGYPRMLVSENHGATGKSSTYLGDAFEFYTGASANGTKVLRIDTAKISGTGFSLDKDLIQGDSWSYGSAKNDQLTSVYDTVSAQSANWGGSALALSAGPGVTLTKSGNTLIAGLDETLLWSGSATTANFPLTLNNAIENYETVKFYWRTFNQAVSNWTVSEKVVVSNGQYTLGDVIYNPSNSGWFNAGYYIQVTGTSASYLSGKFVPWTSTTMGDANPFFGISKIVGCNKTAGA